MNEMNMPYGSPYKDMSEMNIHGGNPYKDMGEMNIQGGNPYKDMGEMNIQGGNPYKDMGEMNIQGDNPIKDKADKKAIHCPKMVLAMAYVPDQMWETPYEVTEGIHRGTLFPALDKPFLGGGNRL
jgi:hypothetical protein